MFLNNQAPKNITTINSKCRPVGTHLDEMFQQHLKLRVWLEIVLAASYKTNLEYT